MHVLVRQFCAWKFYFVVGHSHLLPIESCEPVPQSKNSCFVSNFTYPTSYPWCKIVSKCNFFSRGVLQLYVQFLDSTRQCLTKSLHDFDKKYRTKSILTPPSTILKLFLWPISGIGVLKNKNVKKKWVIWRAEQLIFTFDKKYSSSYIFLQLRNN